MTLLAGTIYLTEHKSIDIYRIFIKNKIKDCINEVNREINHTKHPHFNSTVKERNFNKAYIDGCKYTINKLHYLDRWTEHIPDEILSESCGKEIHYVRSYDFETKAQYAWRNQCLLRDKGCRKCSVNQKLVVHHIVPYKIDPDLRWDPNNGITLCEDCHKKFHKQYGLSTDIEELFCFMGLLT